MAIDLTSFGFTPTESLVYEVLLRTGPGTGYAIARAAGLARANAYSALEGLVTKGAARVEPGRPRRYRSEAPAGLIARISNNHGVALERLSGELENFPTSTSPTIVEVESGRGILQLLTQGVTKAAGSVAMLLPPDAYPLLAPALRRPVSAGIPVELWSTGPVDLGFHEVGVSPGDQAWPGMPIIGVFDGRNAIIGARTGQEVSGHWSSSPSFVAAAGLAFRQFTQS